MQRRDFAAVVGTALSLSLAGVLFGGATRWTACIVSAVAIATAFSHVTSRRSASSPGPLLAVLLTAIAFTALQLLPLPEVIAEIIARPKLDLVRDNASALGESSPTWVVSSFDPPATLVELAKLCGYLAFAWSVTRLASQRGNRPWLATAVVGAALLVIMIASVHHLFGVHELYGRFEMPAGISVASPVVSPNHIASLCAMASVLSLGLAVGWVGGRRVASFGAALVLAAATLLTGSRGGAIGLASGGVMLVVLLIAQRRAGRTRDEQRATPVRALLIGVVVTCVVLLLGMIAAAGVATELRQTRLSELEDAHSKYQVWSHSLELIRDNHWLGVGRGGFESSYHRLAPVGDASFSHAENSFLQTILDWGVPGAAALAFALLAFARQALRRWQHGPLEAAALASLVTLAVHELADFSLELPIVALASIAVAALLAPARLATTERSDRRRPTLARAAVLVVGAAVVGVAASPLGDPAPEDRAEIAGSTDDRRRAATAAFERHPSDALTAGRLAQALFDARDPRAVPVLNRALALRPRHSGLHHLAARMLTLSQRPQQARTEFALALEWAQDIEPILDDVLRSFPRAEDAARAFPLQVRQVWRLRNALRRRERDDVLFAYLERMAEVFPRNDVVQLARAQAALIVGDTRTALEAAHIAARLKPSGQAALALARSQGRTGNVEGAMRTLRDAPSDGSAFLRQEIAVELATHLRARGELPAAKAVLVDAIVAMTAHPAYEATLRRHLALVEDASGNPRQASWERQRADELSQPP